jgi:hypothetical protein
MSSGRSGRVHRNEEEEKTSSFVGPAAGDCPVMPNPDDNLVGAGLEDVVVGGSGVRTA